MTRTFDAYATYYDLLYRDKDYKAEANYVRGLLLNQGITGGLLLELGSGTGRHAVEFARMGFDVHAVDISPRMIDAAQQRIKSDLEGQLSFHVGDVRTLRFDQKFDAVVSLFHVASYQVDNQDILSMMRTAAIHLKAHGVFVFDFWYGPAVITQNPTNCIKRMKNEFVRILRIAEPVHLVDQCMVEVCYEVLVEEIKTGKTEWIQEIHPMRYFFLPELRLIMAEAGFDDQEVRFEEWMSSRSPGEDTWGVTAIVKKRP